MTGLDSLLRKVVDEQDRLRAEDSMTERLAGRFHRYAPRARRPVRRWTVLAAAAVAACAAVAVGVVQRSSALAVTVGASGAAPLGAWLGAPDARSLPLEFSDGSRFELTPNSRARLVALEKKSARVELGEGSLHVHVIPGHSSDWRIDAGAFGVRITGTRFDVSYHVATDEFELSVDEGQVELTGCVFGKGRKLAAGQRVRASCRTPHLDVSYRDSHVLSSLPAAPATPAAEPSVAAEPAPLELSELGAPIKAPSVASGAGSDGWLPLAKAGKRTEAFAAAQREGFASVCQRADAASLSLLAESARGAGAPRQAEQALVALRRRFPGSADAGLAAFTLGRLQFDEFGAYSAAARSFRTYLKERPGGPMTREALGRLMEASQKEGDAAGARAAAERYLRDYPSGPHAKLASRLVTAP